MPAHLLYRPRSVRARRRPSSTYGCACVPLRAPEPDWSLPSKIDENPIAWMIEVNGMLVDARDMPKEVQEEAARKDLIPHVPS